MANTPPPPPLRERATEELLAELCVQLRHVAVGDWGLPDDERVKGHINEVCSIQKELNSRQVDSAASLADLSSQTGWLMEQLLDDCLAFPAKSPFVREKDGIRRTLRCQRCRQAERPPDAKIFWFCNECLAATVAALETRKPIPGVILFRTYNHECRCEHADSESVLACDLYIEELSGVCAKCLQAELERRRTNPPVGL